MSEAAAARTFLHPQVLAPQYIVSNAQSGSFATVPAGSGYHLEAALAKMRAGVVISGSLPTAEFDKVRLTA